MVAAEVAVVVNKRKGKPKVDDAVAAEVVVAEEVMVAMVAEVVVVAVEMVLVVAMIAVENAVVVVETQVLDDYQNLISVVVDGSFCSFYVNSYVLVMSAMLE